MSVKSEEEILALINAHNCAIARAKMLDAYESAVKGGQCIEEKGYQCSGCRLAHLAVAFVRWMPINPDQAVAALKPLCSSLYRAKKPRMDISQLQNKQAYSGFGGGVTDSNENWQR